MKKKKGIESLRRRYGRLFVLHWEIGLIVFFVVPLLTSMWYAVSEISFTDSGVETRYIGFDYFVELFRTNATYTTNLVEALKTLAYSLPISVALSLILAITLNQKFPGRTLMRGIFFLPVIIAGGVVMDILSSNDVGMGLFATADPTSPYGGLIDFEAVLANLRLPAQIQDIFSVYLGNVFNLIWSCGIQIILFLAGLQNIPDQLYEVSRVEGANAWDNFWKITFPMLGNVTLLVLIYTAIENLLSVSNPVIAQAYGVLKGQQIYDKSSAMLWAYFLLVGAILALLFYAYNRWCLRRWR